MNQLIRLLLVAGALIASAFSVSAADLTLSWKDNSTNETGFAIERSPAGATPVWTEVHRTAANAVSWTDTGLPVATTFQYRVRAFNAGGPSPYTNVASGTTVIAPPAAPSDFAVVTVTVVVTVTPTTEVPKS